MNKWRKVPSKKGGGGLVGFRSARVDDKIIRCTRLESQGRNDTDLCRFE